MKQKEEKEFIKIYNASSDAVKLNMVSDLFYSWTKEFERAFKKSSVEIRGVIQSCSINWKRLLPSLKPFSDGCYFTDRAFCEFFYQQTEEINDDIHPREKIDNLIKVMGFDVYETRANDGADRILIIPFSEVKKVRRGKLLKADVNQLLNTKPKFAGMF